MKTQAQIAAEATQGKFTPEVNSKLDIHTTYLINTGLYTENDREDVRSRLSECIWKSAGRYTPVLSDFSTFAEHILLQRRKNFIDKARRRKEKTPELVSLHIPTPDGKGTLGDTIPDSRSCSNPIELIAIRDALAYVRARLTPRQLMIFTALQEASDTSIRGIECHTGIPRSTVARELEKIKALCIEAGIER